MLVKAKAHSSAELTFSDRVRHGDDTIHRRFTIKHANEIGKIIKDRQIVLDCDNIVVGLEELANNFGGDETLLDIEVT